MKLLITLILPVIFFFTALPAEAHFGGQPFIKVNGNPAQVYTQEESISIGDILVPSDIAPDVYLPDKEINFEIDTSVLPFPDEVIKNTSYNWDFGDGTKARGTKVSHTYSKEGPYEIRIDIDYGDVRKYGLGQSVVLSPTYQLMLINILPNLDYKLPKPVVLIDGKDLKDFEWKPKVKVVNGELAPSFATYIELYDRFPGIRIAKDFTFDASQSSGSSKIDAFLWDFNKEERITTAITKHSFTGGSDVNTIAVRIKDQNGFYTDTFFNIADKNTEENTEKEETPIINSTMIIVTVTVVVLLSGISIYTIWHRKRKGMSH